MSRGSLIAKDFFPVGNLFGGAGTGVADLSVLVVSRIGGQTVLKGLRVDVKEMGRLERSNTSLLGVAGGAGAPHREITFSSKGGLSLTCFGQGDKRNCALQSGSIGAASMYIDSNHLAQFKTMVDSARAMLK